MARRHSLFMSCLTLGARVASYNTSWIGRGMVLRKDPGSTQGTFWTHHYPPHSIRVIQIDQLLVLEEDSLSYISTFTLYSALESQPVESCIALFNLKRHKGQMIWLSHCWYTAWIELCRSDDLVLLESDENLFIFWDMTFVFLQIWGKFETLLRSETPEELHMILLASLFLRWNIYCKKHESLALKFIAFHEI